jgi:hypothetical protein
MNLSTSTLNAVVIQLSCSVYMTLSTSTLNAVVIQLFCSVYMTLIHKHSKRSCDPAVLLCLYDSYPQALSTQL